MSRSRSTPILLAGLMITAGCDSEIVEPATILPIEADAVKHLSAWSQAINAQAVEGTHQDFNTADMDGCPFVSADGRTFFMASTRPGGLGGIDIWMAKRGSRKDAWGEPVNVGPPINTAANDFCPTLASNGHEFYFASNRDGGCGGADLYVSWMSWNGRFATPRNLGCDVNSAADEQSPFPVSQPGGRVLYFSSFRAGGYAPDAEGAVSGDSDIYVSRLRGWSYGDPRLASGLNTEASDGHPNVSHDGMEIVFFSARPGGSGGPDIYSATRRRTTHEWSTPVNLGPNVNSASGETRPSLSRDRKTLYFGSDRPGGEGSADIYVATRGKAW